MYMCMLNRRTNILLSKDLWNKLIKLSQAEKVSFSEAARRAIDEKYERIKELEKRRKAIDTTLMERLLSKDKIDYKELINYGRKY